MADPSSALSKAAERFAASIKPSSVIMHIESLDGTFRWTHGVGPASAIDSTTISPTSPFFIASTTKLFVTAVVLGLVRESLLDLDRPIVETIDSDLTGIHIVAGVDHIRSVTPRHLLSHTSGLANYLEDKRLEAPPLLKQVLDDGDRSWTRADIYQWHRAELRNAHDAFAPSTSKAHYSDTNFHLLAELVENVMGELFNDVLAAKILRPLGVTNTAMFGVPHGVPYEAVATMFDRKRPVVIPQAMASVQADGGIVSTTTDLIVFLRSLADGSLLGDSPFREQPWRRVFFPIDYGLGVMRIRIPRVMSPFGKPPTLFGHGGASGTVLFLDPASNLMIAGTVNQLAGRSKPYRLMMRLLSIAAQRD